MTAGLRKLVALLILVVSVPLAAAVPALDRDEFNAREQLKAPHAQSVHSGHDHAICIIFSANPGLPTYARTPDLGKPWEPYTSVTDHSLSRAPTRIHAFQPRAPPTL